MSSYDWENGCILWESLDPQIFNPSATPCLDYMVRDGAPPCTFSNLYVSSDFSLIFFFLEAAEARMDDRLLSYDEQGMVSYKFPMVIGSAALFADSPFYRASM